MTKFRHVKDNYKYLAMQKGYVYPVNCFEVLPGDIINLKHEAILEADTLLKPVLHPTHHYTYSFFVPYSSMFPSFDKFMSGEKDDSYFGMFEDDIDDANTSLINTGHTNLSSTSKVLPQLTFRIWGSFSGSSSEPEKKVTVRLIQSVLLNSFFRHFGIYTSFDKKSIEDGVLLGSKGLDITCSPIPFFSYMSLYNNFFRDKDLDLKYGKAKVSDAKTGSFKNYYEIYSSDNGGVFHFDVGYNKDDCFDVDYMEKMVKLLSVFLRDMFKSYLDKAIKSKSIDELEIYTPILFKVNADKDYFTSSRPYEIPNDFSDLKFNLDTNGDGVVDNKDILTITQRDLKVSEALQSFWEHRVNQGFSMKNYLKRNFGVKAFNKNPSRIIYLGGSKNTVDYNKVLGTGDDNLAEKGGSSTTYSKHKGISFRAKEHGFIYTVSFIRYVNLYLSGVEHYHLKKGSLDFFTPEMAGLGMDQIKVAELFLSQEFLSGNSGPNTPNNIDIVSDYAAKNWGFKEIYDEVRTEHSRVLSNELIFDGPTFSNWHFGTFKGKGMKFEALNSAFIKQENNVNAFVNINENLNGANQMALFYNRYRVLNSVRINPKYSL